MLTIYNTLTKSKEVFKPLDGNNVRMYVCGMTVYDYCHLGHGRSMVAFDLITRWLRFSGYDLTYVRNITDIDDKIINRAVQNNESFTALTERMIAAMHEDEARLNIRKPWVKTRKVARSKGLCTGCRLQPALNVKCVFMIVCSVRRILKRLKTVRVSSKTSTLARCRS